MVNTGFVEGLVGRGDVTKKSRVKDVSNIFGWSNCRNKVAII